MLWLVWVAFIDTVQSFSPAVSYSGVQCQNLVLSSLNTQISAPRKGILSQLSLAKRSIDWRGFEQLGSDWIRKGPPVEKSNRTVKDLPLPRWYIVQCVPGVEDSVKTVLDIKTKKSDWLQKTILEVLVPTTNITKLNGRGVVEVKKEKLMPGYIMVYLRMDKDAWFTIKNTNYVQNFVGHDRVRYNAGGGVMAGRGHVVPTPLTRAEEQRIFDRMSRTGALEEMRFKAGEVVEVVKGQGSFIPRGTVVEVNPELKRYRVKLEVFPKDTPLECTEDQLRRPEADMSEGEAQAMASRLDQDVEARVYAELQEAATRNTQVNPFDYE